ncbi:MAG TPA: hypothetical protein VK183_09095 [Flavobacterium sp.]|nr:hypothetical protein [Flavobacterium sp.]
MGEVLEAQHAAQVKHALQAEAVLPGVERKRTAVFCIGDLVETHIELEADLRVEHIAYPEVEMVELERTETFGRIGGTVAVAEGPDGLVGAAVDFHGPSVIGFAR